MSVLQAIETEYKGPANNLGSRIYAECNGGNLTTGYDYALTLEENHKRAAQLLIAQLKWNEEFKSMTSGMLKNRNIVWVFSR